MFRFRKNNGLNVSVDEKHIERLVDYTIINPTLTKRELENALCVAYKNKYATCCVNPINVKYAHQYAETRLKSLVKISAVIGFPLGEITIESKVQEVKQAISDGADEIDAVIAISKLKSGDFYYVKNEIQRIVRASKKRIVKIIAETSCLTRQELIKVCNICSKCKVDFVQTSTGFAGGGAEIETIEIMKKCCGSKCQVKASGGIENRQQAMVFFRSGATRIGTSREI